MKTNFTYRLYAYSMHKSRTAVSLFSAFILLKGANGWRLKVFTLNFLFLVSANCVAQKAEKIEIQELNKTRQIKQCSCEVDQKQSDLCQELCEVASQIGSVEDYENHLLENNIAFERLVFNEKSPIYYVKSNNVQLDDLVYDKLKKKWVAENPEEYEKMTNDNKIIGK